MRFDGWERLSEPGNKCGAHWRRHNGWVVSHCGHPTANHPYEAASPDGLRVLHQNGRGFPDLKTAIGAIDLLEAGACRLFKPERGPTRIVPNSWGDETWG